jgi:hypothetical protein
MASLKTAFGAIYAFSRRPLSLAFQPFIAPISKGSSGSRSAVTQSASRFGVKGSTQGVARSQEQLPRAQGPLRAITTGARGASPTRRSRVGQIALIFRCFAVAARRRDGRILTGKRSFRSENILDSENRILVLASHVRSGGVVGVPRQGPGRPIDHLEAPGPIARGAYRAAQRQP